MAAKTAFLEVFPCCSGCAGMCGGLDKASLSAVIVDRENLSIFAEAFFAQMPAPAELNILQNTIAAEYSLRSVEIVPDYPKPEFKPLPKKETKPQPQQSGGRKNSSAIPLPPYPAAT
ncbi:MAG: hypothetical protein IJV74_02820 [Clostridia bacterium]|nr:hypothetical protein [Clostridia bacterium]